MSLDAPPRVSIGLPVRNGALRLPFALESLLGQSYSDFELIISDNASSDSTEAICREAVLRDARVRYHRQTRDIGVLANFEYVLAHARGELFMWAAHDDLWEQAFVETLVRLLDDDPGAVLAFSRFDNVTSEGVSVRKFDRVGSLGHGSDPATRAIEVMAFPEELGKANLVYGLIRTDVLCRLGGLRAHAAAGWGLDYHLVFELAWCGRFAHVPELLFHKTLSKGDGRVTNHELRAYIAAYPRLAHSLGFPPIARVRVRIAALRFQWRITKPSIVSSLARLRLGALARGRLLLRYAAFFQRS